MNKDVQHWTRTCLACNVPKSRYTQGPPLFSSSLQMPDSTMSMETWLALCPLCMATPTYSPAGIASPVGQKSSHSPTPAQKHSPRHSCSVGSCLLVSHPPSLLTEEDSSSPSLGTSHEAPRHLPYQNHCLPPQCSNY